MRISIVIATYNSEKFISRTIRSCIEQSMNNKDYEIIVVDDGSTDNTRFILESFGDWIRPVYLEKNMGLPYACNFGIKKALSRFIIRVDADDYIHEDLLKIEDAYLEMNNADAVACDYLLVDEGGNRIRRVSAIDEPNVSHSFFISR